MIKSMTGFGCAETQHDQWTVRIEVRTVNHKDLQVTFRLPDAFYLREAELQKLIEKRVRRGHVYFLLTCQLAADTGEVLLDQGRARSYMQTLRALAEAEGLPVHFDLATLLRLPGVLRDAGADEELRDSLWPHVLATAEQAVEALAEMRAEEGRQLNAHLSGLCAAIERLVAEVEGAQSSFVIGYRDRLRERVAKLLQGTDVMVNEDSLAREVAFYADRCDISEEVARMRSHLKQFRDALDGDGEPVGRKMGFLGQEMLREANTMGSKIPAGIQVMQVLELKSEVERLREQVHNVE